MKNYEERDGLKYIMEQRWYAGKNNQFPTDLKNCIEKFKQIESKLDTDYHPLVDLGAAISGDGLLTDHGPDHVQMVMRRAHLIIGEKRIELLNGYEIFILLLSCHFHDVGNIYTRNEHEQKITDIMNEMGSSLPLNIIDKDFIKDIAMAHGGYIDKSKADRDTIRVLKMVDYRDSIQIRPSLLAAILRFADELSDDFSRANKGKIKIPPENEIYHAYSSSLEVNIKGDTVSLRYRIPYEHTQKKMIKDRVNLYLYDEIKNRLEKCIRELEYCRKYSDGFIGITTLDIVIYVIKDRKNELIDSFSLRLHGYPSKLEFDSYIERYNQDGTALTEQKLKYGSGEELMNKLKGMVEV